MKYKYIRANLAEQGRTGVVEAVIRGIQWVFINICAHNSRTDSISYFINLTTNEDSAAVTQ